MARSKQPPTALAIEFGARLRARREALGLSQMKLAEEASLHFTYISDTERGLRNIGLANIVKLAVALEVDPADLVAGLDDLHACPRTERY
jgi:transcriptional regulator with XRE-family HTH domain